MKRLVITITFIALALAFTPSVDTFHHGVGKRKPLRKAGKAVAKLVLPCR